MQIKGSVFKRILLIISTKLGRLERELEAWEPRGRKNNFGGNGGKYRKSCIKLIKLSSTIVG
jgi:hypothetical protein